MAKSKILGLMNAFQGIKDITGIAIGSLRKTTIDALKTLASNTAIFEVPKDAQANAKDVGLKAIRKPEAIKKSEGQS